MSKKFFIHYNPSLSLCEPLKNNSQSYAQTNVKPFYCTKCVIAPVKGFWFVREMQECTTVLFHRKKTKNNHMLLKTCYWKLIFVICSCSTWTCKHAKHARHIDTWARKHARYVATWARKHARHAGTWARAARNLADSYTT